MHSLVKIKKVNYFFQKGCFLFEIGLQYSKYHIRLTYKKACFGYGGGFMFYVHFVWDKLKGKRALCVLGLLLSAVLAAFIWVNPKILSIIVDDGIKGGRRDIIIPLVICMVCFQLVYSVGQFARSVMLEKASQHMLWNVRRSIFHNIQHQDLSYFSRMRAGDIITRTTGDLEYLRHFVAWSSYQLVDTVVIFFSAVICLFFVSVKLTLIMLSVLPLILAVSYFYSKTVRRRYKRIRESLSQLNIAATENIDGNRTVKAFTREEYEEGKFAEKSNEYRDAHVAASVAWAKVLPLLNFFSQSLTIFNLLAGGLFVIRGEMTLGGLAMFNSLAWALSSPMNSISNLLNDMQRFFTSAEKVVEITEDAPIICDRYDAVSAEGKIRGNIELRDVSFSYKNSQKILDSVSVKISAGQTVAIMGRTGCGKTTLVNLLARFYDPSEGSILFDGVDLRYRRLEDIHRSISIATQDVFLFSDTVDGNIAFSDSEMSEESVVEYATLAGADGFIKRMESGYETIIGERGVGISGGQRQRIALARALAAEPSVLVLDDTTSAVDTDTEAYIQHSLRNLPFECTKVIIAQRISSVMDADMIIIMENGKFSVGRHDTLVRTNAYYRELCELQGVREMPPFDGGDR